MAHQKFDLAKLERLNDPGRFDSMIPAVMWDALGSPKPRVIVDIGAGTGLFAEKFAEFAPGATVYAADMAPEMVEWMRAHRAGVASGRLVPLLSTETGVDRPDAGAQLVMMLNLHHELAEPAMLYAEALRLLEPGGQLLVVDWAARETPKGPPLAIRASVDALDAFLRAAGFVDIAEHEGLPWHTLVTARRPTHRS